MILLLLAALAGLAGAAAPSSSSVTVREVALSTTPSAALPLDIPALKRRIRQDQDEVLRARAALKKAERAKSEAARAKAREAWTLSKERLKADRKLLREAIEAREGAREPSRKGATKKP